MAELKPCPFCGGEAEVYRMKRDSRKRFGVYHMIATIKCRGCTAQVSQAGYDEERAIENSASIWNRRANEKCPACKFWLWFEEEHGYRCSIKGCWHGSKFVEFKGVAKDGKRKDGC